jgi:hypothetical protein
MSPLLDQTQGIPVKRGKSKALTLLRFVLSSALLALVIWRVGGAGLGVSLGPSVLLAVAASAVLLFAAQVFSAIRWKLILGEASPPLHYLVRLCLVGQFFSLFLPSAVGGDALRMVMLARNVEKSGEGVSSVFFDRLVGVFAMLIFLVVGAAAGRDLLPAVMPYLAWDVSGAMVAMAIGVAVIGCTGLFVLYRRWGKLNRLVAESVGLIQRLATSPLLLVRVVGWGLVVQGTYLAAWVVLAFALGFDLPFSLMLLAVPLVSLIAMLPISISGVGLREGLWLLILTPFGVPGEQAVGFSLLYFAAFVVVGLLGGAWFALRGASLPASAPLPAASSCS